MYVLHDPQLTNTGGDDTGRSTRGARTANEGSMMPEQVWDRAEPDGFRFGEGTESATPLGWMHAQFVRLAWSIDAGALVETPAVVACRYVRDRCAHHPPVVTKL